MSYEEEDTCVRMELLLLLKDSVWSSCLSHRAE